MADNVEHNAPARVEASIEWSVSEEVTRDGREEEEMEDDEEEDFFGISFV